MKNKNIWQRMTRSLRAFLILALAFLALGLGTLGSAQSFGNGYVLSAKRASDGKERAIILNVFTPEKYATYVDEEGETQRSDLYIKEVYFNLGTVYNEYGGDFNVRLARGTSWDSEYYTSVDIPFTNLYSEKDGVRTASDSLFNWVKYETVSDGWRISTYPYYKITVTTSDTTVLINEVVFVGYDRARNEDRSATTYVLGAALHEGSVLPYDTSRGETIGTALERASAILDRQHVPSTAQSSFFRFGPEETYTLMTVAEMRQGRNFSQGSVYHLDGIYNSLGTSLVAFGTLIGGMSPFGLRLMPFLASFGVLVFGFLLVRKLTGSEKAGLVFSVLYALCGASFSLGHFGTPLMIGVFFFTAALYFTVRYFKDGMKETGVLSAVPALLGGLFAGAAICVNGAFVIPDLLIVGLFIAGIVRHQKETRVALDAAIDEVEADEGRADYVPSSELSEPRKRLGKALRAHRYNGAVSGCAFFAALILGAFLLSVLFVLPMYFTYVKLYDDPTSPTRNVFYFLWRAFAGGFTGENFLVDPQSVWSVFYVLFKGTGESFGVTATGFLISGVSLLAGVAGTVLAIVMLARRMNGENFKEEAVTVLVPLIGVVLGLVTAAFAKGGLAFLLVAYICLFAIAAKGASEEDEGCAKTVRILSVVCLFLLAVAFGLFAVFTFSIPTGGFLSALWA